MKKKLNARATRKNIKNAHYVTHLRMTKNTRLKFQAIANRLESLEGTPLSDSLVFEKLLEGVLK